MDLYDRMAPHYDFLFPLNPLAPPFFSSYWARRKATILDTGCATGSLCLALAAAGHGISGIDLNARMIAIAGIKAEESGHSATFLCADMRDILNVFGGSVFDGILCFGNTLPHLESHGEVKDFLANACGLLRTPGYFFLQILNYDLILKEKKFLFPDISAQGVLFRRRYEARMDGRLDFLTDLSFEDGSGHYSSVTILLPLVKEELEGIFSSAGFNIEACYADYQRNPARFDSFVLHYVLKTN